MRFTLATSNGAVGAKTFETLEDLCRYIMLSGYSVILSPPDRPFSHDPVDWTLTLWSQGVTP